MFCDGLVLLPILWVLVFGCFGVPCVLVICEVLIFLRASAFRVFGFASSYVMFWFWKFLRYVLGLMFAGCGFSLWIVIVWVLGFGGFGACGFVDS